MKILWNIIRALVNAPDAIHWIRKYESAKTDNDNLRKQLEMFLRELPPKERIKP